MEVNVCSLEIPFLAKVFVTMKAAVRFRDTNALPSADLVLQTTTGFKFQQNSLAFTVEVITSNKALSSLFYNILLLIHPISLICLYCIISCICKNSHETEDNNKIFFFIKIMSIVSDHPIWQRKRRNHHGGAWRDYMKDTSNECASPRGPGTAPFQCSKCHDPSSKGNSPMVTSDYYSCSSQSSSEDETFNSSFNMQGTCGNLRNCG